MSDVPFIRTMTTDDLDVVHRLEEQVYSQPWSLQVFTDELALPNRLYLVATLRDTIVGYAGLMMIEDDAHITTLAVTEAARRHRVGSRLMLVLVDAALASGSRHLTLEVRVSNSGAQKLYSRFGLAPVGVRKNYYRTEDALVMWANDIDTDEYRSRLDGIREALAMEDVS